MSNYFSEPDLLKAPTERAAFSDRQAYVCAELSKIAYFRFEGGHTVDAIIDTARDVFGESDKIDLLSSRLKTMLAGAPEVTMDSRVALAKILEVGGFELIETFNKHGTQAFLCKRRIQRGDSGEKVVAYLAFRGTEPTEFKDIKTDISARLITVEVAGQSFDMHQGYHDALKLVDTDINRVLEGVAYDQLIVCGHSLGGALGIAYTRFHATGVNGACYTFGAPPVGAVEFQNGLKTPVYEIINELDIVPRLPNPWLGWFTVLLLRLLRLVAKSVTLLEKLLFSGQLDEKLEAFLESMTRYRHPGYLSYLVGVESEARLRYNLSTFDRLSLWVRMIGRKTFRAFNKLVADHNIDVYIAKLRTHAMSRNPSLRASRKDDGGAADE